MKRIKMVCVFLFWGLVHSLVSAQNFKLVEKWDHGDVYLGYIYASLIDNDGHLLICSANVGIRLLTPKTIFTFAPDGEGPGEIMGFRAWIDLGTDIGILERQEKLQVYSKKNGNYVWKENLWFKRERYPLSVKNAIYHENKWYFTGEGSDNFDMNFAKLYNILVFNDQRQPIKKLLTWETRIKDQHRFMSNYIIPCKERLFFMKENELSVTIINSKDASVVKTVKLEQPACYKPMPENFYAFKQYKNIFKEMLIDHENWRVGYSRISKVVVDGNYLVLQIRTCNEKLKRFCLLFYNVNTFKLEHQVFMDDYFLGAHNGKYYAYRNGDPSLDEDTDRCVINIYQLNK